MSEITTYTGIHIDPVKPKKEQIEIRDIAHALSLITRGNGHLHHFFSVGQHCILCAREAEARGLGRKVALAALLHDASECYMSDVPRPFKDELTGFREMEEHILDVIYGKYLETPLTEEEKKQIKEIDDAFLYFDLKNLLSEKVPEKAPEILIAFSQEFVPFEEVEQEYLDLFERLSS